ncbi:omega-amidase, chloroplastic [Hordeum vulgare]|nr:omega-amidase, chloroplastic [Hordeum vulgare]
MRAAATSTAISLLSPSRFRTSAPASLPYRRRPRIAAMAAAASSSFRPEAARLPAAVETPAPPLSKFKVALCRLSVTADKARNIARARAAIESAATDGAKLVLLPMQNNHSVVHPKESGECSLRRCTLATLRGFVRRCGDGLAEKWEASQNVDTPKSVSSELLPLKFTDFAGADESSVGLEAMELSGPR